MGLCGEGKMVDARSAAMASHLLEVRASSIRSSHHVRNAYRKMRWRRLISKEVGYAESAIDFAFSASRLAETLAIQLIARLLTRLDTASVPSLDMD